MSKEPVGGETIDGPKSLSEKAKIPEAFRLRDWNPCIRAGALSAASYAAATGNFSNQWAPGSDLQVCRAGGKKTCGGDLGAVMSLFRGGWDDYH